MELSILEERIRNARLNIYQPDGQLLRLGQTGPLIDWHIHTRHTLKNVIKHPALKLGTSYVNGEWASGPGQLTALIDALLPPAAPRAGLNGLSCLRRLRARLPHPRQSAPGPQWSENSLWLSRLCLGEQLLQLNGDYHEPGISTEQAQRTAVRRLEKRLGLKAGQHLLDLNAGWGTLAIQLAEHVDLRVTALVKSREQLQFAHGEVRRRGLDGQVHVRLGSFHQCRGRFDRILANDFLEHYVEPSYPALFEHLESLLDDRGLAWLQVRGSSASSTLNHLWYRRQLPARSSLPLLSDVADGVESTRLRLFTLNDRSGDRLHDLDTRIRRFQAKRPAISRRFGEKQTRLWEYTLASEAVAYRRGQLRNHEYILGNRLTRWPLAAIRNAPDGLPLPVEFANKIPGLARDI